MRSIGVERYRRVVVLPGAGISVASGLPTFRGPGGLWERPGATIVSASTMQSDPGCVWSLFDEMCALALRAEPNAAHRALARAEESLAARGSTLTLLTQNVDGLHQRAGSQNVVELHGSLFRVRCSNPACSTEPVLLAASHSGVASACSSCGATMRPDIVLFDEPMAAKPEWDAKRSLRECDLFVAVGTSGTVSPASNLVRSAAYAGAPTILVNLEPMRPAHPDFREQILGRAEDVLPRFLESA